MMERTEDYERVSLEEFSERTKGASFVAIDTEFVRERSYWSFWCLVQVAAFDAAGGLLACVVDLLDESTNKDVLRSVLYEGDGVKVFHAGKQDWEILARHFGGLPAPVFDTQIAAALLGYGSQCGYERLARLCLSVEVDKAGQYADWQKRPLSEEQIRYALGDVVYLARLYPLLREQLEQRGRVSWLEDIQRGMLEASSVDQSGEESFLRLLTKMRSKDARRVLRRLCRWREALAKRWDRPRQWVCADAVLVTLSKLGPTSVGEVRGCRALAGWDSKGKLTGEVIEQVCASAKDEEVLSEDPLAARKEEHSLLSVLRALQRVCGEETGIAVELLGGQGELLSFARGGEAIFSKGWRHEVFGEKAETLLAGKLALYVEDGKICTKER